MFAFGFKHNQLLVYRSNPSPYLTEFIRKKIHPHIQRDSYYLVACYFDGYAEHMPPPTFPLTYYYAPPTEFEGAGRITSSDPGRYPLLHRKKAVLCFSKRATDTYSIPIPDPYYMNETIAARLSETAANKIPWEKKLQRCVWRGTVVNGGPTGIRASFVARHAKGAFPLVDYATTPLSIPEQMNYRYLLDLNGWTNSWDATVWKLSSGSVVLKADGDWEQWYYPMMKPWVHYIPVRRDLRDLNEQIEWCIAHDAEAAAIAAAGENFIREMMRPEVVIKHTLEHIRRAL
jgi:hypothetical protein